MRAGRLALPTTATGTSPSRSAVSGDSSSNWPRRIAQASPAGPGPHDQDADLDSLLGRSLGGAIASDGANGGR